LYCFEDRGNRRVALRPELTPSLARLVIQKGKSVSLPLKWFAVGQCWRYERMTRGRRREHYQWNMDIIGVPEVMAEAELLSSIITFFKGIGITSSDVGFKVSSRKVLQELLRSYEVPDSLFGKVCIIIDKIEKIPIDEIKRELKSCGISEEAIEELLHVLSVKSLSKLEGSFFSILGEERSTMTFSLLKEKGLLPELRLQVDNIVCALDHDLQGPAATVATILRQKGQSVDLVLENKPLKWVFRRAARINASRLILVGKIEWQKGMVGVKVLSSGEQYEIKLDDLE
ncbi:histidine--tRNA ligase, chloroplastic/mitochondrial-like, partial [Carica papaya]|uniref:histidine--tRNA ligase, chloroplastic/mitochondrial-like n=1 Tax=Carica papaya TaxID=3649 RepID=UPI000B8CE109